MSHLTPLAAHRDQFDWNAEKLADSLDVIARRFGQIGDSPACADRLGALWFTEPGTDSIGRIPVSGSGLTEYKIPTANSGPAGIVTGTDNALWFVEQKAKQLGRMAVTGEVTAEYPLNGAMTPDQIVQGVDGNFYFTDTALNKIGQFITRGHKVAFYHIPTANSQPTAMTLGLDSQVYFVETAGNKVAQFRYFNV